MENRSKKLATLFLICLVLPLTTFMSLQGAVVNAEAIPVLKIKDVTSNEDRKIEITLDITLVGFNFDFYVKRLNLYLNQSEETILDNDYESHNTTKVFTRQDETTFETNILSPELFDGSLTDEDDSAYYNITLVAITSTNVKSKFVHWKGGYIFIDNKIPEITFINPVQSYDLVWGNYPITAEITDSSNISLVEFYIDETLRYVETNNNPEKTIFTWNWLCSNHTRGKHFIKINAVDNSSQANSYPKSTTIEVVGPEFEWVSERPTYVDTNTTLNITLKVTDLKYNVQAVKFNYSLDDSSWTTKSFIQSSVDPEMYNLSLPEQPIGTKITWEVFANNTEGEFQLLRDENLEQFLI